MQLNQQQKKCITAVKGPVLVLAIPGSGKSTSLTYRTKHLIENNINPENILT